MMLFDAFVNELGRSSADAWELTERTTSGWEFYFVRHELDQNWAIEVGELTIKVFKRSEDGQYMGNATAVLPPTTDEAEIGQAIEKLIYQASLVKNKPYDLVGPSGNPVSADLPDLYNVAKDYLDAMNSVQETKTEDINSYEIFCSNITVHFANSCGVDIVQSFPVSMAEVVVNARDAGHEIELYRMYNAGTCDGDQLRKNIQRTMEFGRDRLKAEPTPEVSGIPILLSTSDAVQVYYYFLDNLDVSYVYRHLSSFELGKEIAVSTGDRVTVRSRKELPNSSCNLQFDPEGSPVRDLVLMEQGVPKAFHGSRMFSSYLGLEGSFLVQNWEVSGGSCSEEEIRQGDHLEIVEFSDFQVDPLTGDIFGEIRLGYLHQNGEVRIVTGGSVSGDLKENLSDLRMTREQVQYNNVMIPAVTRLSHVSIAGVKQ